MEIYLTGCAAFAIMIAGDFIEYFGKKRLAKALFLFGFFLLDLCCAVLVYLNYTDGGRSFALRLIFGGMGIVFFALLIYALFFALPFKATYVDREAGSTVDCGVYAVCRHPGIWFFALLMLCLWAALELPLYAAVTYSVLNLAYAILEDTVIFPRTLEGYHEYKKKVPFMIPKAR